jgi:hypothetical protein
MRSWGVQGFAASVLAACFVIFPLSAHATGKQSDTDPAGSGGCDPGSKYDPSLPYPQKNPQTGKIGMIGLGCQDTTDGFVTPGKCVAADKCQAKPPAGQSPPGGAQQPPSLPSLPSVPTDQPPQPSTPQTQTPPNQSQTTQSGQVQTPPASTGFTDNPSELTQSPPNSTQPEPSSDLGQTPPAATTETFTPASGLDQTPPDSSQSSESPPSDQIQTVPGSPQDTFTTDPQSENTPSDSGDDFSSHCGSCMVSYSAGWTESSVSGVDEFGPDSNVTQYSGTAAWAEASPAAAPDNSTFDNAGDNLPLNPYTTEGGTTLPPYVTDPLNFPPESLSQQSSGLSSDDVPTIEPVANTNPGGTEDVTEPSVPPAVAGDTGPSGVPSPPQVSNPPSNPNPVPQVPASPDSPTPLSQTPPAPPPQTPGQALLNSVDPGLGTTVSNMVNNVNQSISQAIASISRLLFP